jgi:hypothetical protein
VQADTSGRQDSVTPKDFPEKHDGLEHGKFIFKHHLIFSGTFVLNS